MAHPWHPTALTASGYRMYHNYKEAALDGDEEGNKNTLLQSGLLFIITGLGRDVVVLASISSFSDLLQMRQFRDFYLMRISQSAATFRTQKNKPWTPFFIALQLIEFLISLCNIKTSHYVYIISAWLKPFFFMSLPVCHQRAHKWLHEPQIFFGGSKPDPLLTQLEFLPVWRGESVWPLTCVCVRVCRGN